MMLEKKHWIVIRIVMGITVLFLLWSCKECVNIPKDTPISFEQRLQRRAREIEVLPGVFCVLATPCLEGCPEHVYGCYTKCSQ